MERHGYNPKEFVYENPCRGKAYGRPVWRWTPEEGRQWDAEGVLEQVHKPESGSERRWEKASNLRRIGAWLPAPIDCLFVDAPCVDDVTECATQLQNRDWENTLKAYRDFAW